MYRDSDLEVVKLHFQEFYAEAERNRLIKQSGVWEERRKNRWYVFLLNGIAAWMARWRCILQGRLPQSLFPGLNNLALNPSPCTCAPEPCTE